MSVSETATLPEAAACTDTCRPFAPCEMAVERATCPIGLSVRFDAQHEADYLAPVGAILLGVEHAHASDRMLLVVDGGHRVILGHVGEIRFMERRHGGPWVHFRVADIPSLLLSRCCGSGDLETGQQARTASR